MIRKIISSDLRCKMRAVLWVLDAMRLAIRSSDIFELVVNFLNNTIFYNVLLLSRLEASSAFFLSPM